MYIGYVRVSAKDQNLDLQIDRLKQEGCNKIFEDVVTGSKLERKGLNNALSHLREGDTLVIWKLDRLGRSLIDLIGIINKLNDNKIGFKSIQDSIDTNTPSGKLFFHISTAFAEYERNIIIERTQAGLKAARARGRLGGRKKAITPEQFKLAYELYKANSDTVINICNNLRIKRRTFYRYLNEYQELNKSK